MLEFGATLARFRQLAGLSTASLARPVNLDPMSIERFEGGEARSPDRQLVLDLAHAMNLTETQTDELLWSANYLPHRQPASDGRDVHNVALFVDHENVYIALSEMLKGYPLEMQVVERRKVETAALAHTLRNAAEQIGFVKEALAIADWERLPPGQVKEYLKLRYRIDYNLPGRNSADLKLSDAMRNVLEHDVNSEIDTYILVTGDGGYLTVLDTLLQRQKQVLVWSVRGATSAVLHQNATKTAWVEEMLGVSPPRLPVTRSEADHRPSVPSSNGQSQIASADPSRSSNLSIGNDVSRLEALAIHLTRHLRQRSWSYITFVRFLGFLAETGVFGVSREEQLAWLSHAKETGVLREEIMDDPTDPTRIARRFRLNDRHQFVERALAVSARINEVVPVGGRGLAFGVVVDRLINDPELMLTDIQAKNWLTWFTENGYLLAEMVPHFRKEGVMVTLLRQNPGYWDQVATIELPVDRERPDFLADACVIRLVNFLERHPHFAWMALSQLLNQMSDGRGNSPDAATMNRHRSKGAIALAQEKGLIIVEQIPNLKTGGTTTVARLNRESERVIELLSMREALVRRLGELLVSRSSVSRGLFQSNLVERHGLSTEEAGAWIELMVEEGLFTADPDHEGLASALRVDHQDLIVSRILFRALQGTILVDPERA